MRVTHFRVERYRSIERSKSIDLSRMTVLVGPNNEGKSNILRALVVGLEAISAIRRGRLRTSRTKAGIRSRVDEFESYDWERDFPKHLQAKTPNASSTFEFSFELDAEDLNEFKRTTGHSLNGELKLRALVGRDGNVGLKVVKRGPGNAGLNESVDRIADFVTRRVRLEYVPTSRSSEQTQSLIRRHLLDAWSRARQSQEFVDAAKALEAVVRAEMEPVERLLLDAIGDLYPAVEQVSIEIPDLVAEMRAPGFDVLLDDGSLTRLSAKGDGVQSLVAMSLVRALTRREVSGAAYILAVEEPEAHLHPGGVRRLSQLLREIAETDQVVLTTHSPILVNRGTASGNILVEKSRAQPATSLDQVRRSLGIELPDNLASADLVLLVEGVHDATILRTLMRSRSAVLSAALESGRFRIQDAGGASHIPYHYRMLVGTACAVHVVLDDDKEGRRAARDLEVRDEFESRDLTIIARVGASESELEDLFDENSFADLLLSKFNVDIKTGKSQAGKRFAKRLEDYFLQSGAHWNGSVASNVKAELAKYVAEKNLGPAEATQGVVDALVRALEAKLPTG